MESQRCCTERTDALRRRLGVMAFVTQMTRPLSDGNEGKQADHDGCQHSHQARAGSHDGLMIADSRHRLTSARASQFKVAIDAYRRTHFDRNAASWNEDTNFSGVITDYEARLRRSGLIDFDDMMLLGLNLVESYEWVRRSIVAKFPILAVDEYQDLGLPLHRIVMNLCFGTGARLFAVGDADQSIYSFTGARPELLKQLSEREDVTSVTLPFNYRSAPEIVAAGEATLGEPRGYTAKKTNKGIIEFHYFENGLEEQVDAIIADLIPAALERDDKRRLGDVAIIYTDYNDGNLVSGVAAAAGLEFVRIDSGAPIPTTPMIRWLQDCAEWCAGGCSNSNRVP